MCSVCGSRFRPSSGTTPTPRRVPGPPSCSSGWCSIPTSSCLPAATPTSSAVFLPRPTCKRGRGRARCRTARVAKKHSASRRTRTPPAWSSGRAWNRTQSTSSRARRRTATSGTNQGTCATSRSPRRKPRSSSSRSSGSRRSTTPGRRSRCGTWTGARFSTNATPRTWRTARAARAPTARGAPTSRTARRWSSRCSTGAATTSSANSRAAMSGPGSRRANSRTKHSRRSST
mmetsp:Transcript_15503/g.38398  ORF Transcript_15503/g.38398 Transcript_15503/m.38398 type:complete len:231 (+) Transcript_15503:1880-2572(+)